MILFVKRPKSGCVGRSIQGRETKVWGFEIVTGLVSVPVPKSLAMAKYWWGCIKKLGKIRWRKGVARREGRELHFQWPRGGA